MTFWQAVFTCFRKYADFNGRASPTEYRSFSLFAGVADVAAFVAFIVLLSFGQGAVGAAVLLPVWLVLALPMEAVTWRRYHDMGRSGVWSMWKTGLEKPGEPGWNRYGPPPGEGETGEQPSPTSAPAAPWWAPPPTSATPPAPAVFVPCPGCGKQVNREVGRCPYCQTDLGPAR